MDPGILMELIGSYAFPIVMCVALLWMINTTMKDLQETINQNTTMLTKLIEKIGGDADD